MSLPDARFPTKLQRAPPGLHHDFLTDPSSQFHSFTTRSCYVDFPTALPIELSLQILQHLPPTQTILLRSVSRRYNNLLTSPETCRFLTLRHFPWSTPPTHATPPPDLWVIHYENTLSRRLRFEHGRPSRLEYILEARIPIDFCAAASTLASTLNGNHIQVHLLTTSPPTLILPPKPMSNLASITRSVLTQSIVAAICKDTCQIWNLATHATHSFPISAASISALSGDGNIIVIAVRDNLLIHNAAHKTTKTFDMVLQGLIPEWQNRHMLLHVAPEPTRRVWVGVTQTSAVDNAETTVTALSLDTAAVVVPTEKFYGRLGLWKLTDNGFGARVMGSVWENGSNMDIKQLQIDTSRTTEAVCLRNYSIRLPNRMREPSPLYPSVKICSWRGVNWARAGIVWTESELKARTVSASNISWGETGWIICCVGENIVVVCSRTVNIWKDNLAVLRFDGVHDKITSADFGSISS